MHQNQVVMECDNKVVFIYSSGLVVMLHNMPSCKFIGGDKATLQTFRYHIP